MKVRFSRLSVYKLEKLLEYLQKEWSESSKINFVKKLNDNISIIQQNPQIFPASKIDLSLRKCVITKQTSILYEIRSEEIFVVNIIDSRQDPGKIREELKEYFG